MIDYANAPAPHGALFDNAPQPFPAVTMTTTTGSLTPAVKIARDRNGQWYAWDVYMQYGAPVPLALALRRVAIGRTVFVAREDAASVLEAVRGTDGQTSRLDA